MGLEIRRFDGDHIIANHRFELSVSVFGLLLSNDSHELRRGRDCGQGLGVEAPCVLGEQKASNYSLRTCCFAGWRRSRAGCDEIGNATLVWRLGLHEKRGAASQSAAPRPSRAFEGLRVPEDRGRSRRTTTTTQRPNEACSERAFNRGFEPLTACARAGPVQFLYQHGAADCCRFAPLSDGGVIGRGRAVGLGWVHTEADRLFADCALRPANLLLSVPQPTRC